MDPRELPHENSLARCRPAGRGDAPATTSGRRRLIRAAVWLGAVGLFLAGLALAGAWWTVRASLPRLDGQSELPGLQRRATVERDALGVPTVTAADVFDAARATGFVHAQDRFFQMDQRRRWAAGEYAALLGPLHVDMDRRLRSFRFRSRAVAALNRLPPEDQALLDAYAVGVNAGLASLTVRPVEYLASGAKPEAWLPEDSLLVAFSTFLPTFEGNLLQDLRMDAMARGLPADVTAFLMQNGSAWSARLDGTADPLRPIPGPDAFAYLRHPATAIGPSAPGLTFIPPGASPEVERYFGEAVVGSNSYAVSGSRTPAGGGALIANDPHLSLRDLPPVPYRARLVYATATGATVDASGFTLPGLPGILIGSNGSIAWAYTASCGDTVDIALVEMNPDDSGRYRTPEGWHPLTVHHETIAVAGAATVDLLVEETIWGPLLPARLAPDFPYREAVMWSALDVDQVNLAWARVEHLRSAAAALDFAPAVWVPANNFVVGDRDGNIGWTIAGPLPERKGFDGERPVAMADGSRSWRGAIAPNSHPRILNPPEASIWTANQKMVGGDSLRTIGNGGYATPHRAFQARARLQDQPHFDEAALFALQLDAEVFFLRRWQQLLLTSLDEAALLEEPERTALRSFVENWNGSAATDSVGYRLIRDFRLEVNDSVLARILAPSFAFFHPFHHADLDLEEPIWLLVSQQPEWVASDQGWRAELLAALDAVHARDGPGPTADGKHLGTDELPRSLSPGGPHAPAAAPVARHPTRPACG